MLNVRGSAQVNGAACTEAIRLIVPTVEQTPLCDYFYDVRQMILMICNLAKDRTDMRDILENATGNAASFFRCNPSLLEWIMMQRREWVPRFTAEPLMPESKLVQLKWFHRSRQERLIQHRAALAVRSGLRWIPRCCKEGRPI